MTVVFPDGIIVLVPAGMVQPSSLVYFPDGQRYAVTEVVHYSSDRVQIEGRSWAEWQDATTRRPHRAQCEVMATEVIPVLQLSPE